MGTIGSRLAQGLDGDKDRYVDTGEFMGECRAHGVKKRVTPEMLEAWGEQEYAAMTVGIWGDAPICPSCHEAIAYNGSCWCSDGVTGRGAVPGSQEEILARLFAK